MTDRAHSRVPRAHRIGRCARTVAFSVACLGAAVGFALTAAATGTRVDLTARGEHRLSPRAAQLLESLDAPVELILAVDEARLDRRAFDRVGDVLDAFDASPNARVTRLDTGSARGADELAALAERLVERERPAIEAGVQRAAALATSTRELAAGLGQLSTAIQDAAQAPRRHRPGVGRATHRGRARRRRRAGRARRPGRRTARPHRGRPRPRGRCF
jgi:hypothetical protein